MTYNEKAKLCQEDGICQSCSVQNGHQKSFSIMSNYLIVDVEDTLLDLLVDLLRCVDECLKRRHSQISTGSELKPIQHKLDMTLRLKKPSLGPIKPYKLSKKLNIPFSGHRL